MIEYLIIYLALINLFTFLLMFMDKRRAKNDKWRIPEKNLFTFILLGGSIGGFLGMKMFRHKIKRWYFNWGIPAIILIQFSLVIFITRS
ncbi:MAG TPA: DUF1294 domain-containing protein [Anaerovoracaceae bacterium]|nr:DUF1294 domain-containing protein [Anaerovoracaceae bacterium]